MIIREKIMANFICPFSSSVHAHVSSKVAEKPGGKSNFEKTDSLYF